jgi:hypothetical protein
MGKVVKLKVVRSYQSKEASRIMRDMTKLSRAEAFKTVAVVGICSNGELITAASSKNQLEQLALIGGLERIKQRLLDDMSSESE